MFAATVALLVIAVLVFVGYPLVRPKGAEPRPRASTEDTAELRTRLAELELDHHLGLLPEEEFRQLSGECERKLREGGEGC